jgi:ABC-type branched-subunit amino acid transport system permease subunit
MTAVLSVAVVLPMFLTGSQRLTLTATVAYVLVFASLSLLVGLSRQLSLAHGVFVALGATTLAHLRSAGVPFPMALLLAGLLLTPLGAVLAIPAVRLSSLYLGLATFAFGILAQTLLFRTALMFGVSGDVFIRRPGVLAGDMAFYYFVLAVVAAGVVAVEVIRVTRLGRVLVALADSPTAIGSLGINSVVTRVVVFCLSAVLAGVAGGLLGTMVQAVNTASFTAFQSLVWVTVLVTAGTQTFGGVVLSAVLLVAVPGVFSSATVSQWQPVIFGGAAIVLAQADNGLIGLFRAVDFAGLAERNQWRRESRRRAPRQVTAGLDPARATAVSS